ncbi:glycosyltransferase family 8 protein [Streptomyces sp. MP131-18]|uniref:glycosyltransferase family 8 protein n=1 Tax=Streptomyces sp. MP131-18 TaxID=1857892 RepID=UPI00097C5E1B|nr:glycosyltransferase family 8 protein [Streptomyces sp. MP131-18]ONK15803.1 General stress protein A [Streptomyces sp. MP131-18]
MTAACHFALCVGGPYTRAGAVVVASLARHFAPSLPLAVWVCHSGISPAERALYEAAIKLKRGAAELRMTPLPGEVIRLPVQSDYITSETFGRLALARLLPADVTRVVYLDADLLILGDLSELSRHDLAGATLAAVREASDPFCWSLNGLEHVFDLGLDPAAPYFNAGILVMDLPAFRATGVEERCLAYLARHRPARMDQDALNAVCRGRIGELPVKWNVEKYFFTSEERRLRYRALLAQARILHYVGHKKPWTHDTVWRAGDWHAQLAALLPS